MKLINLTTETFGGQPAETLYNNAIIIDDELHERFNIGPGTRGIEGWGPLYFIDSYLSVEEERVITIWEEIA